MPFTDEQITEAVRAYVATEEARASEEVTLPGNFAAQIVARVQETDRRRRESHSPEDQATKPGWIWNWWQAEATRGAARRPGWQRWIREMLVARVPQMAVLVAAMLLILVVVWVQFAPDQRGFRTPDANLAADGLPSTLRVSVRAGRTTLEDAGRILSALLNSPRRGAGISVFDVDYSGTNAQGNRISFKGTMVVTNAAGVVNLKNAKDISGILLDGEFTIGNLPPVPIRQPFVAIP